MDGNNRIRQPHPIPERGHQAACVLTGTAIDRPPRVLGVEAEEPVIVEEPQQGRRRELEHAVRRRAPDRAAHRHEEQVEEILTVPTDFDVLTDRDAGPAGIGQRFDRLAVEPADLKQHPVMPRAEKIPALGEEVIEAGTGVLEAAGEVLHREGHVRGFHGHLQFLEKADQPGVGHLVEHHEPGVERHRATPLRDVDGVGVSPDVVVLLEERQFMTLLKQMGAAHSGHARSNDGQRWPCHAQDLIGRDRAAAASSLAATSGEATAGLAAEAWPM